MKHPAAGPLLDLGDVVFGVPDLRSCQRADRSTDRMVFYVPAILVPCPDV